jgi:hypothetical protein
VICMCVRALACCLQKAEGNDEWKSGLPANMPELTVSLPAACLVACLSAWLDGDCFSNDCRSLYGVQCVNLATQCKSCAESLSTAVQMLLCRANSILQPGLALGTMTTHCLGPMPLVTPNPSPLSTWPWLPCPTPPKCVP